MLERTAGRVWLVTALVGLATSGLVGCGKNAAQMADDSKRNLELAGGDSSYRANDRAAPPAAPAPAPSAPAARSLTVASGTTIEATTERTISSRHDKAGETFTALTSSDVKDSRGRVVVPAGSRLELRITELKPANDKSKADGRITVAVSSVSIDGRTYPISASITSMAHTLKGRGVGAAEVEKTAAGVVVGGIAGRVIGGNAKGTIIGAVVGGAAGAAVAIQTANRDVVVVAGTPIEITLNGPMAVSRR